MTPSRDEMRIADWAANFSKEVKITLKTASEPPGPEMERFCLRLTRLAPNVQLAKETSDDLPAIRIAENIVYRAVPEGQELPPFLETLENGKPDWEMGDGLRTELGKLEIPAALTLYVAPQCPHCPAVARKLLALAVAQKAVRLTVVDAFAFPDDARADGVRSVPAVLLDGACRWSGDVDPAELVSLMCDRDPLRLGTTALRGLIEDGDAAAVADLMREAGAIIPAFLDLLVHPKWPVRLGALVALEHLAEAAPALAVELAGPLWERFATGDGQVRGDILYALGECAGADRIADLEAVAETHSSDELREAATEARDRILERLQL